MQTVSAKASAQPQTCSFNLYDDDLAAKFGLVPQSSCAHKMVATQYKGPYKAFMKGKTCTKYKMCVITTATECEKASKDLVGYGDAKADVMVNPSKAAGCWYVWQLHLLKFNNLFAKQHVQAGDPVDVICKPCTYEQYPGAGNCAAKNKCDVTTAAECTAASKELLLEDHDPDVMDDGAKAPGCFYVPTLDKKKRLKFNKKIAGNTAKSGNAANNICKACPQIAPTTTVRTTSKLTTTGITTKPVKKNTLKYKGSYKAFIKGKTCTKNKMCVITTAAECEKARKELAGKGYKGEKAGVMEDVKKAAGCWYVWQLHLLKFNNLFAKHHVEAGDPVDVICTKCTYTQHAGAGNCAAKNMCDVTTAAECTTASKELLLEDHAPDVMDDGSKAPGCFYVPGLDKAARLKFNKKVAGNTAKSGNAANNVCKECPKTTTTTPKPATTMTTTTTTPATGNQPRSPPSTQPPVTTTNHNH